MLRSENALTQDVEGMPPKVGQRRRRQMLTALLSMVLGLACSQAGHGQSPAGPPLTASTEMAGQQYADSVVVLPDGSAALTWTQFPLPDASGSSKLVFQSFDLQDLARAPFTVARNYQATCCFYGLLAANSSGNLVLGFTRSQVSVKRFGFPAGPQEIKLETPGLDSLAMDSAGDFVATWESSGENGLNPFDLGVFARLVDPQGRPVGPQIHVNTVTQGEQAVPTVSMAANSGAFVVVWQTNPTGRATQVAGQLFDPTGARIGGEFRVGSIIPGYWLPHAKVAMVPHGSFVVVWQEPDPTTDGSTYLILGQRFTARGRPLGPTLRISDGLPGPQEFPNVACDPHGNFVVTWNNDGPHGGVTMARLYHANGVPVRPPVALTPRPRQEDAFVAFGWNGTFAIAWTDLDQLPIAHVRRFSASPGEEICQYSKGEFDCYTGRSGEVPTVHHPFGGRPATSRCSATSTATGARIPACSGEECSFATPSTPPAPPGL